MKKLVLFLIILTTCINVQSQTKQGALDLSKSLKYASKFSDFYDLFNKDADQVTALCGLMGGSYVLCKLLGSESLYEENTILKNIREKAELDNLLKKHKIDPDDFYMTVYESKSFVIQKCETFTNTYVCKPAATIGPQPKTVSEKKDNWDQFNDELEKGTNDLLKKQAEQNKKNEEKKQEFLNKQINNSMTYVCTCYKCGNKWECQGTKDENCCVSCSKCGNQK